MCPVGSDTVTVVAISEKTRHDLCTRFIRVPGEEPAESLMTAGPAYDPSEILTRENLHFHLAPISAAIEDLRRDMVRRFEQVDQRREQMDRRLELMERRFDSNDQHFLGIDPRFDLLGQRIDRLSLGSGRNHGHADRPDRLGLNRALRLSGIPTHVWPGNRGPTKFRGPRRSRERRGPAKGWATC